LSLSCGSWSQATIKNFSGVRRRASTNLPDVVKSSGRERTAKGAVVKILVYDMQLRVEHFSVEEMLARLVEVELSKQELSTNQLHVVILWRQEEDLSAVLSVVYEPVAWFKFPGTKVTLCTAKRLVAFAASPSWLVTCAEIPAMLCLAKCYPALNHASAQTAKSP
jgi:hypothetical protein